MDLDAYRAAHEKEWTRLQALSARGSLSGAEADEFIARYQSAASDLSVLQASAGSTPDGDRLGVIIARSRLRFTAASKNVLLQLGEFFVLQLPTALYRIRWLTLAVALATILIAVAWAIWLLGDPQLVYNLGTQAGLEKYASEDFYQYYSEYASSSFGAMVWTNNAWIAAQAVAFGVTGIWVPFIIAQNAQGLGQSFAILHTFGHGGDFFLYIAPHGMLELTAIFVAAAAGLRIFWAWVAPGKRPRLVALAEDGRSLITVAIGLVFVLGVSGVVEGFVTGSELPWPVKIGIGAAVFLGFLAYMLILGRKAYRSGETGDLGEFESGAQRVYAG
ncbi:putative membrane protein SpoIIM required for sporulation [Mycetocola sp. BIGb0189]|uniref:stage II sporulation protein M n=1 Tax=Mycetocola sp. BIGb0189 TaxID=2940604 RepID=UPI002169BADD|nr:stage II sporulation protein M [Mycetocola sp. BIGb0189]MCS4276738.1 putative membrane protein SpoIIM required for sporulation [Mycetocola sp. BIGb0189]